MAVGHSAGGRQACAPAQSTGPERRIAAPPSCHYRKIFPPTNAAGDTYDDAVVEGVKRFQLRPALEATGTIGPQTLKAAERAGESPAAATSGRAGASGGKQFHVRSALRRGQHTGGVCAKRWTAGKVERRYRVIVGKAGPAIADALQRYIPSVVLNPTWTVPFSITKGEIINRMRRDPGYINRMHMRVLNSSGGEVDAKSDRLVVRPFAEFHGSSGFRGVERAWVGQDRHAEPILGLSARYGQAQPVTADYRFLSHGCARVDNVRDLARPGCCPNSRSGRARKSTTRLPLASS